MYKSYYPKASEIERKWVLVDADGQNLGRIATRIAHVLLGKHKPTFTPGVEMGDYVVVINAEKVTVTGTKTSTKLETKMYHRHSNYPGGYKSISLRDQLRAASRSCAARRGVGHAPAQPHGTLGAQAFEDLRRTEPPARHESSRAVGITKEERNYGTVL